MTTIKERDWKTKFVGLPSLLKFVVICTYFISTMSFLRAFIAILQLQLDGFALAYGYLIWELAGGLVEKSNLARVIAILWFGCSIVFRVLLVWNGGTIFVEDFKISGLNSLSIIWAIACASSILILLLPQVRKLFSNSTLEEVTQ